MSRVKVDYTHSKKNLNAFSFANFETTTGSTGMANVSFLSLSISTRSYEFWFPGKIHNYLMIKVNYTDQKKLPPDFLKFKLNKRGVSFLRECSDFLCSLNFGPDRPTDSNVYEPIEHTHRCAQPPAKHGAILKSPSTASVRLSTNAHWLQTPNHLTLVMVVVVLTEYQGCMSNGSGMRSLTDAQTDATTSHYPPVSMWSAKSHLQTCHSNLFGSQQAKTAN